MLSKIGFCFLSNMFDILWLHGLIVSSLCLSITWYLGEICQPWLSKHCRLALTFLPLASPSGNSLRMFHTESCSSGKATTFLRTGWHDGWKAFLIILQSM